jgi:hypothetical protein
MSYYDTIEGDLARAKAILERGKPDVSPFEEIAQDDAARIREVMGGTIYGGDIYAAYKLLESFVAEIARLRVEHTRAVLHYTAKGYQAGENADAKHWRQRAEEAEAEIARLLRGDAGDGSV